MPIEDFGFEACVCGENVQQPIAELGQEARGAEEDVRASLRIDVDRESTQIAVRAEKTLSVILALGSGGTGDLFPLESPTSDADAFDALMDLFNLAASAWSANGNVEASWGIVVLGSIDNVLPKPVGAGSIPDRMFEVDGADSSSSAAVPTEAELLSAFNGANSAAGITWTGADPNSGAIQKYGAFAAEGATYSTLHGLNANGSNDPGEPGNAAGTANTLPAVVDQYLFDAEPVGSGFLDWLRMASFYAHRTLSLFQMSPSDITWENILPAPVNVSAVTGSNPGEIDVSWDGDNIYWAHEDDALFEVYYGLTSDDVTAKCLAFPGGLTSSPITITGLLPGITYFIAVTQNKAALHTSNIPDIPGGGGDYFLQVADGSGILSTIVSATSGS